MKKGFTLIEMLVASLLLGMLVVILTMVFNASSVAWRTGKASVADLNVLRRGVSLKQLQADNAVAIETGASSGGVRPSTRAFQVTGAWEDGGANGAVSLRKRAIEQLNSTTYGLSGSDLGRLTAQDPVPWAVLDVNVTGGRNNRQTAYLIGVRSYGPDKKPNTADDITSLPEDLK